MTLHIYRANNIERVRRLCPCHKVAHYGSQHEYYDTTRIFFDCGTEIDLGYGYWKPPKPYKKITIFEEGGGYSLMSVGNIIGRATTKRGARRIARYHLKEGGVIKEVK